MHRKLGFIYSRYFPLGGGVSNATKNFAEALVKDGNQVTVYTIIPLRSKLSQKEVVNGVEVRRFRIPAFLFKIISFGYPILNLKLTAYWVAAKIRVERRKHDLIFGHNIQWGGVCASIIGKINNIPSAAMAHGEDVNQLESDIIKEKLTLYSLQKLDFVFSTNIDFTDVLLQYSVRKILPLPNIFNSSSDDCLDFSLLTKRFNKGNLKLICIGRLDTFGKNNTEIKGFSIVLKAMKTLPRNISLEIIGEGPLFSKYTKFITNNNLEDRISLLGQLPFQEVQYKLNNCSIVLLPSNIEGLSMVMLEAMSKGLPLLASNIAGAKDYITDNVNGLLIEPGDINKLITQIEMLAGNFELYKKVSYGSQKTYEENFTEKAVIKILYKHLNW